MSEPNSAHSFSDDYETGQNLQPRDRDARLVAVCGQITDLLAGRYPNYNKPLDLDSVKSLAWVRSATVRLERGFTETKNLEQLHPFRIHIRGKGDGRGSVSQMYQVGLDGANVPKLAASFVRFSRLQPFSLPELGKNMDLGAPVHPELQLPESITSAYGLLERKLPLMLPDDLIAMEQVIQLYAQQ